MWYIYIYILISRLHQMYEGRNRIRVGPVFTPDNPGHRPRKSQTQRDHVAVRYLNIRFVQRVIYPLLPPPPPLPLPLLLSFQSTRSCPSSFLVLRRMEFYGGCPFLKENEKRSSSLRSGWKEGRPGKKISIEHVIENVKKNGDGPRISARPIVKCIEYKEGGEGRGGWKRSSRQNLGREG